MSNSGTKTVTAGSSALTPIFVVLFILKVAGLAGASWGLASLSWWWVFSPLLLSLGIALLFLVVFLIIALISTK